MIPNNARPTDKKEENSESALHADNMYFLSKSTFRGFSTNSTKLTFQILKEIHALQLLRRRRHILERLFLQLLEVLK